MTNDDDDQDWSIASEEPARREDGKPGPPDDWLSPSWYEVREREILWWWRDRGVWRPDPCPVRALGMRAGEYVFITSFGEIRHFTSNYLHGRGGLPDLFVGEQWWPLRHFRKWDPEVRAFKGGVREKLCIGKLMSWCKLAGYYDGRAPQRGPGTWRGPDGMPIVHCGNRIFVAGSIQQPGLKLGDALFVVGGKREPPTHDIEGSSAYSWTAVDASLGHTVSAHLDEWVWDSGEARDLFQGGLWCDMLCSALSWLPHKFIVAPQGSGKSSLLHYASTLVGGGAHRVQKTYTKAFLEQDFGGAALAFYLDEAENESDGGARVRHIFELVRLLSDDGAEGGRGSASGKSRRIDVHGTVTMAATVAEDWQPQDRSRITLLEVLPFKDRDRPPASPEMMAAMTKRAAEISPDLRARAVARFDLFRANLKVARAAILDMGGQPRDADQLGNLIAGWRTMTSDAPFDAAIHEEFTRFRPFVMSLVESEDGDDAPSDLLNVMLGQVPDLWRSGERFTVGELVALARSDEIDAANARKNLGRIGLRFEKKDGETWNEAWLGVANKHAGLDKLLAGYPGYQGRKRSQILKQLQRGHWKARPSAGHMRFAKVQSRYVVIPPVFLPTFGDDDG